MNVKLPVVGSLRAWQLAAGLFLLYLVTRPNTVEVKIGQPTGMTYL